MIKILTERQHNVDISYEYEFSNGNGGFGFPCDKDGNLDTTITDCAKQNYQDCINGKHPELKDMGIVEYHRSYIEPATGKCPHCGATVELRDEYMGAFQCECGQWYNTSGQELIDPKYWEDDNDY